MTRTKEKMLNQFNANCEAVVVNLSTRIEFKLENIILHAYSADLRYH